MADRTDGEGFCSQNVKFGFGASASGKFLRSMIGIFATSLLTLACSDGSPLPLEPATPPDSAQVSIAGLPGSGSPFTLVSQLDRSKCMDVYGGSTAPGTQIQLWSCNGGSNQQFAWRSNGEIRSGALCLDAYSGRGNDGDRIVLFPCHGGENQKWKADSTGEIQGINGKCLDAYGANSANGTKLVIWRCHGRINQKWDVPSLRISSRAGTGIDTLFAEGFESGSFANWDDRNHPWSHHILSDSRLAHSGNRVLEINYPKGSNGGSLTKFFMPGYDSLYVSYHVRLEPEWRGYTKLLGIRGSHIDHKWSAFGKAGLCPKGTDFFSTGVVTEAPDKGGKVNFYTYYPKMQRESDGKCWGRYGDGTGNYASDRTLTPGKWHRIEFWVKLNRPDREDASQKFWIDGELRAEWSGISLRKISELKLNSVMISASATVPKAQRMYVDDLLVTTAPPPGSASR